VRLPTTFCTPCHSAAIDCHVYRLPLCLPARTPALPPPPAAVYATLLNSTATRLTSRIAFTCAVCSFCVVSTLRLPFSCLAVCSLLRLVSALRVERHRLRGEHWIAPLHAGAATGLRARLPFYTPPAFLPLLPAAARLPLNTPFAFTTPRFVAVRFLPAAAVPFSHSTVTAPPATFLHAVLCLRSTTLLSPLLLRMPLPHTAAAHTVLGCLFSCGCGLRLLPRSTTHLLYRSTVYLWNRSSFFSPGWLPAWCLSPPLSLPSLPWVSVLHYWSSSGSYGLSWLVPMDHSFYVAFCLSLDGLLSYLSLVLYTVLHCLFHYLTSLSSSSVSFHTITASPLVFSA